MLIPLIDQHAVVGDLRTTALIARDGTVDSMCLPDADSPSVFAALLDPDAGHFGIELADLEDGVKVRRRQNYLPNTNILITRLQAAAAVIEIRDYMVVTHLAGGREGVLVRTISALHGDRRVRITCWPGFDYARAQHDAELSNKDHTVTFRTGDAGGLRLECTEELELTERGRGPAAVGAFSLGAGQSVTLVLSWLAADGAGSNDPALDQVAGWTARTEEFWHRWIDASTYNGRWSDAVRRSALCLKLLQHEPTGGIVAAPTFGLPEWPGAARNWDYRYVWLRDAAFVMFAFLRIGLVEEASGFAAWLAKRCADIVDGTGLHPVYRLDGSPPQEEQELGHLRGYADSRPVRIGNNAYGQTQLDVLGEVLDGLYLYDRVKAISWDLWRALNTQLGWLAEHWRDADAGIWEVRGENQQFVSSKVLVWVAFERAGRLARRRGLPGDLDRWRREAEAAYTWVQEEGWHPDVEAYTQRAGSTEMDASALLIPMLRFASGTDPRVLSTLAQVTDQLATDSLVHRYRVGSDGSADGGLDGVGGAEATFTVCSFWYVENMARAGKLRDARIAFEKILTYANEVGLFSEQIGPAGEALGNFPQALTHLALISAATTLDREMGPRH